MSPRHSGEKIRKTALSDAFMPFFHVSGLKKPPELNNMRRAGAEWHSRCGLMFALLPVGCLSGDTISHLRLLQSISANARERAPAASPNERTTTNGG
jgi:hypothetical protein